MVMEGLGGAFAQVARFNEISDRFAEPMEDEEMNKLLEEQAKLQDAIDAVGGWELERKLEIAADALRLPPWDAPISTSSRAARSAAWRCAGCCCRRPTCCCSTSRPTISMPSPSPGSRNISRRIRRTVIAVTHDRYFLDNVAEWILELDRGHGIPVEGQLLHLARAEGSAARREERTNEGLRKQLATELEWVRTNPKARQAKNKARVARYEELASREFQERNETNEIYIPPGERLGDLVIEAKNLSKSYGDRLLIDNLNFRLPAGGIVGIIGPNGAGKTTLFRMIAGHGKARRGRDPHGPVGEARLRRPVAPVAQRQEHRLAGDLRRPRHDQGRQLRDAVARLCRPVQLQGHRTAAEHRRAVGRRAQSRAPRQGAEVRRQRADARRAHQRPRRRDAAGAGRGPAGLSRAAQLSSRTTAGSWIASPPTSWPSKATPRWYGSRATSRTTWKTSSGARAKKPRNLTGSSTSR